MVESADLNADGFPDLILGRSNELSVLIGNGNGTFQPEKSSANGGFSGLIRMADLDGDGFQDLVTKCSIYMGNGDGTFQNIIERILPIPNPCPFSLEIADFNADDIFDLVIARNFEELFSGGGIFILLGNGDGTFQAEQPIDVFDGSVIFPDSHLISVADLNNDTFPDIISTVSQPVEVLLGNGDGTFQAKQNFDLGSIDSNTSPDQLEVADLNNDGILDLLFVISGYFITEDNPQGFEDFFGITALLGNGDGTFQAEQNRSRNSKLNTEMVLGDLNVDGNIDIAILDISSGEVELFFGNGNGTFSRGPKFSPGHDPISIVISDLNVDGAPDLVTYNFRSAMHFPLFEPPFSHFDSDTVSVFLHK